MQAGGSKVNVALASPVVRSAVSALLKKEISLNFAHAETLIPFGQSNEHAQCHGYGMNILSLSPHLFDLSILHNSRLLCVCVYVCVDRLVSWLQPVSWDSVAVRMELDARITKKR